MIESLIAIAVWIVVVGTAIWGAVKLIGSGAFME